MRPQCLMQSVFPKQSKLKSSLVRTFWPVKLQSPTKIEKTRKKESDLPKDAFELSLATVFRNEINESLPDSSSLGNKSSDIVGYMQLSPNNFFSSNYKFSLDNNFHTLDDCRF